MKKTGKVGRSVFTLALVCSLYGCGSDQNEEINYSTEPLVQKVESGIEYIENSTEQRMTDKETEERTETVENKQVETKSEDSEQTATEGMEKEEQTEKAVETTIDRETELKEMWDFCWEDGEVTFEETELILQAAGYFINEFGFYEDSTGRVIDSGIAYDFILSGFVFQKQEDGSFELVSDLEENYEDYDVEAVNDWIRSYGYQIEYNNDIPCVYDGNGDYYSYEEFAELLLNGNEIPYAPADFVAVTENKKYDEFPKGNLQEEKYFISADGYKIYEGDIVYYKKDSKVVRGTVAKIGFLGSNTEMDGGKIIWDSVILSNGEIYPLYTENGGGNPYYTDKHGTKHRLSVSYHKEGVYHSDWTLYKMES